jgi:hypothetical protein
MGFGVTSGVDCTVFFSSEAAIYDGVMLIHDIELPIWLPTSDCAISIAHCAISMQIYRLLVEWLKNNSYSGS